MSFAWTVDERPGEKTIYCEVSVPSTPKHHLLESFSVTKHKPLLTWHKHHFSTSMNFVYVI